MRYNTKLMRTLIVEAFDDLELIAFCHDYFPEVSSQFGDGMGKEQKAFRLITWCERRERMAFLLECIKQERPEKFGKYEKQLTNAEVFESTAAAQTTQVTSVSGDTHPPGKARVFLSYAREDEAAVTGLYQTLRDAGHQPWMDKQDIVPGELWENSIRRAIAACDFVLICISAHATNKRGFLQKEIKAALDTWQGMLDSDIYLVPVRLEPCLVPENLSSFQWVDVFENDGIEKLLWAIQEGLRRRSS